MVIDPDVEEAETAEAEEAEVIVEIVEIVEIVARDVVAKEVVIDLTAEREETLPSNSRKPPQQPNEHLN